MLSIYLFSTFDRLSITASWMLLIEFNQDGGFCSYEVTTPMLNNKYSTFPSLRDVSFLCSEGCPIKHRRSTDQLIETPGAVCVIWIDGD